jgi:hypothetical protein
MFQSKENISKFKFFTDSFIQKTFLQQHAATIRARHERRYVGLIMYETEGFQLQNLYPDVL